MRHKIILLAAVLSLSACHNSLINTQPRYAKPGSLSSPSSNGFSFIQIPSSYLVSSSQSVTPNDYFYCERYGPFPLGSDDFDTTFTYTLNTVSSQNIIERMRLLNASQSVIYASSKAKKYYTTGTNNSVAFTVPLHDYWTTNGLTIRFEIVNASTYSIVKEYSATIYPPSNATLSAQTLKNGVYISKSLGFYGDNSGLHAFKETIDFTHFGDYLDVNNYYKLDTSKNVFSFPNDYEPTAQSLSLTFNDSEYLFPYCKHDNNGNLSFPLVIAKNNNNYSFKIAAAFFLNKRTLQISEKYRQGFIVTTDFYLPINGKRRFNGKLLYIHIENFGLDGISTVYPIRYDVSRNLVGTCSDGDFCVEGGSRS